MFDFINKFTNYVLQKVKQTDVYLVFDRYHSYSIKRMTRSKRAGTKVTRKYHLHLESILPPQHVVLKMQENKVQLLQILCEHLLQQGSSIGRLHKLVVTSQQSVPVQVTNNRSEPRLEFKTDHEEADVIIVQQTVVGQRCDKGSYRCHL